MTTTTLLTKYKMPDYTRPMGFDNLGSQKRMPDEVAEAFTDGDETTLKAPRLQSGYFNSVVQTEGVYDENGVCTGTQVANPKVVQNRVKGWERMEALTEILEAGATSKNPEDALLAKERIQLIAAEHGVSVKRLMEEGLEA